MVLTRGLPDHLAACDLRRAGAGPIPGQRAASHPTPRRIGRVLRDVGLRERQAPPVQDDKGGARGLRAALRAMAASLRGHGRSRPAGHLRCDPTGIPGVDQEEDQPPGLRGTGRNVGSTIRERRMRSRPRRPARSLRDFVEQHSCPFTTVQWPCITCGGYGRNPDPNDRPGPEEDRGQRSLQCSACHGSGEGTKKAWQEAYAEALRQYQAAKREYERFVQARKEALRRLTREEIQALRELGV